MYFPLTEVFRSQSEPAFCGISSLCMILNCVSADPTVVHGERGIWKGPWRWYHEDLLDCCKPLEDVKKNGISMEELDCLAQCNGLETTPRRICKSDVDDFREMLKQLCRQAGQPQEYIIANYDRKILGQTGSGHFSPIGAYEAEKDMVLILDVARFKYPPHWVALESLVDAMASVDADSEQPRGYIALSRSPIHSNSIIFTTSIELSAWNSLQRWIDLGFPEESEDIFIFIQAFRNNYPAEFALNLRQCIKDTEIYRSYMSSTSSPEPFRVNDCDAVHQLSDCELDRMSWTLLKMSVQWSKLIMAASNILSSHTVSSDMGSYVYCGSINSCCRRSRKLKPTIANIPLDLKEEISNNCHDSSLRETIFLELTVLTTKILLLWLNPKYA